MAYVNGNKISFSPKFIKYDGYDTGFKDGQISVLESTEVLKGYESGPIITVNDVSPIEHSLGVNVKSKNIFDADTVLPTFRNSDYPSMYWKKQEDGSWYLGNAGVLRGSVWFENTEGYTGQMAISITAKVPEGTEDAYSLTLNFMYTDGTHESIRCYHSDDFVIYTLVSDATKVVSKITQSYAMSYNVYLKDIMIAYGTDTTYIPYITDFSTVNVTRCGKNFFDADAVLPSLENPNYTYAQAHWSKQADGSFHLFNVAILAGYKWFENTSGYEGQMTISITGKVATPVENQNGMTISFEYTDNTRDTIAMPCSEEYVTNTLVSNPNKTIAYIYQSYSNIAGPYIKDIMIAYGTDTEYEPYNPYTVTANADGTVEGLTSISPNMTLLTDTDGVTIDCNYYKDIDKAFNELTTNIALSGGN